MWTRAVARSVSERQNTLKRRMKVKSRDFKKHQAGMSSKRPSPASGGAPLDRFVIPRVRNYAYSNSIDDIDEVAEHLRSTYREYKRQKVQIFRMQVARAVAIVRQEPNRGEDKPEALLQAMEQRHLTHKAAGPHAGEAGLVGKKRSRPHGLFLKEGNEEGDDDEDSEGEGGTNSDLSSDEDDEDEDEDSDEDSDDDDEDEEDAAANEQDGDDKVPLSCHFYSPTSHKHSP